MHKPLFVHIKKMNMHNNVAMCMKTVFKNEYSKCIYEKKKHCFQKAKKEVL